MIQITMGAPSTAVTALMLSSVGANTVRASPSQNRQKAANQVSQEKRATVRSMSQIGKANRQAVETNQGAVMVFFGMLVTVTVSRGEQESQRLEAASRAVEQAAGGAKIDLRPCYGAQDTGFAASLPLGLNVRSYTPAGPLGRLLS